MSNSARRCIAIVAAIFAAAISACTTPADSPRIDEKSRVGNDASLVADRTVRSNAYVTEMEMEESDAATSIGQWIRQREIVPSVVSRLNEIFAWQDTLEIGHGRCGMEHANFVYVPRETEAPAIILCHELVAYFAGLAHHIVLADSADVASAVGVSPDTSNSSFLPSTQDISVDTGVSDSAQYARAHVMRFVQFIADIPDSGDALVEQLTPAEDRMLASTLTMGLLHEAGHAVIDVMKLPVFGQQEPTADELGQLLAIEYLDIDRQIIYDFIRVLLARDAVVGRSDAAMQDAHGPAAWRAMRFACRLWASDPVAHADIIERWQWLTPADSEGCTREWKHVLRWKDELARHLNGNAATREGPIARRSAP